MEDGPDFSPADATLECTVSDVMPGMAFHKEQKAEVQSRWMHRIQKLREHHDVCEDRYETAQAMRLTEEREKTLLLHHRLNATKLQKECSNDSEATVIVDHTKDTSVPELKRADSIILNRQMLGYTTEDSLSSFEFEYRYIPAPGEETSDSSSEDGIQHKGKKTKSPSAKSQKIDVQKRRRVTSSSSLDTDNSQQSSSLQEEIAVDSDGYDSEDDDSKAVKDATPSSSPSSPPSSSQSSDKSRVKKKSTADNAGQKRDPYPAQGRLGGHTTTSRRKI